MHPQLLCSAEEFRNTRTTKIVTVRCAHCECCYDVKKIYVTIAFEKGYKLFCTKKCSSSYNKSARVTKHCKQCGCEVRRRPNENPSSKLVFCNRSCAATYRNTHKEYGSRRSKLEVWLEDQLTSRFDFKIEFNKKGAIKSELDIFIPSLNLAFEINGIFHYEPIYGEKQLKRIQLNDAKKIKACAEKGITLHSIDASKQSRFTEESSTQYLQEILSYI